MAYRDKAIMRRFIVTTLVILLAAPPVRSDDLGGIGKTYDITECDLIEVIQNKLKRMEKTGELAKFQHDYKNRVIDGIEHPKPIPGIQTTATANTHYYDPSMEIGRAHV